jgi:hypothetical protein
MSLVTYSDLLVAVAEYLARDDLTARIPDFIKMAEAKFNRSLKCRQMEIRSYTVTDLTSAEPQMISLPSDFQTMRSIKITSVSDQPRLEYMTDAQLDEYRTSIASVKGRPRYFSVFGTEMELAPTPDTAYTIEMKYRAYIPSLTSTNMTNWLMALAPDLYLYGTLLETAPYMNDDPRLQTWGAGMSAALDGINSLAMDAGYGSGPLVIRTTGINP